MRTQTETEKTVSLYTRGHFKTLSLAPLDSSPPRGAI